MRRPDFFIVGAPRSGTTAMKRFLWEHPEIFLLGWEPNFFGTDLNRTRIIRDEQTYLSLFTRAKNEKRVGEKSVWYLMSKRTPTEIKQFQPSASIIIMLRNPVDMLYSLHSFHVHITGLEDILDFEAALEADQVLYRDTAHYTQQVKRFLVAFGREKVHIIIFDDFIRDIARIYRDTLRFLEVNPDFQPDFRKINANRRVRSKTLQNFLIYPPKFVRSLGQAAMLFPLFRRVLWALTTLNSHYFPRQPISPEVKRRLQAEFLPEVEQLSKLLGRDLTHWCKT